MYRFWGPAVVCVVLLFPTNGNAQAERLPEPPPQVTAANADWQMRGEPIFFASNFYWPTGPDIFFDGAVLVRTGQYDGIPLYANPFLQPYSVVYVPIGGGIVRPYMRRSPEAGVVGSAGAPPPHVALRPVPVIVPQSAPPAGAIASVPAAAAPVALPPTERAVGTAGTVVPRSARSSDRVETAPSRPSRTVIGSTPPRGTRNGVWLTFNGARYYSAGASVPYSADRFVPIGVHAGFPVYRDTLGRPDEIFVAAVQDGPLAPYCRP
jgi:hypothetical protein